MRSVYVLMLNEYFLGIYLHEKQILVNVYALTGCYNVYSDIYLYYFDRALHKNIARLFCCHCFYCIEEQLRDCIKLEFRRRKKELHEVE